METKQERLGLDNLIGNTCHMLMGEMSREKYRSNHIYFLKQPTDCFMKIKFTTTWTMKVIEVSLPN